MLQYMITTVPAHIYHTVTPNNMMNEMKIKYLKSNFVAIDKDEDYQNIYSIFTSVLVHERNHNANKK